MNIPKETHTRIKNMIAKELADCRYKLRDNKYNINKLTKEQRTLKSEIGELYKLLKQLK